MLTVVFVFMQVYDDAEQLKSKVHQLAEAVRQARHLVIYTGAGISTVSTRSLFYHARSLFSAFSPVDRSEEAHV